MLLLLVVFFGHYVAGLSGHEPVLLFSLGLVLLAVEIFFFPGVALPALLGLGCMLVSLVWAMADFWPNEPLNFSGDVLVGPLTNLGLGLLLSIVLGGRCCCATCPRAGCGTRWWSARLSAGPAQVAGVALGRRRMPWRISSGSARRGPDGVAAQRAGRDRRPAL